MSDPILESVPPSFTNVNLLQFNELLDPDYELVAFHAQMFIDIYVYDQDPLPPMEEFFNSWLTRPNNQYFWVYRDGARVFPHQLRNLTYAIALKSDLEVGEVNFEWYTHIPTLHLINGFTRIPDGYESRENWYNLLLQGFPVV